MKNRRCEFKNARREETARAVRNAEKMRVELKLGSWNVNSFAMRAVYLEYLIAHEELDALFVCETLQSRCKSGIIPPLKFEGNIVSMPAQKRSRCGRESMGNAFITKKKEIPRKESAPQGNHWQVLEVRHAKIRLVGLYASPSATAQEWTDINVALKRIRSKRSRMVVCGDCNASDS